MKDGIININKPQNMTSFDVVAILRKKLGVKRVGHLGTLDPMAEGVLPIAIGKAARVMDYLKADIKEYVAEFVFGVSTDTNDIWGEVISLDSKVEVTKEDIESALKTFMGVIAQIPPRYSALKVDGRKLYDYARAGESIEIKSRDIYISSMDILDFGKRKVDEVGEVLPYVALRISCSKGTYIRSIARDMGERLGTCATMSALMRTKSGAFRLDEAISLDNAREMETEDIERYILDADYALERFPSASLSGAWETKLFRNGVKLEAGQWNVGSQEAAHGYKNASRFGWNKKDELGFGVFPLELPEVYFKTYRVYGECGFIGLGVLLDDGGLKADKVFI